MSYWNALIVSGSCVVSASSPPCGIENGLCEKSIFLFSSSYSYIGKSTTQASSYRSLSTRFNSSPSLTRASPANFQNLSGSPATKNAVASLQAELGADRRRSLRTDVVGQGARALIAFAPHDVAQARLPFPLRPRVH